MVRRHRSGHTARIWLVFGLIALALFITVVATRPSIPGDGDVLERLDHVLLWYSLLPRGVAALTCGAALGLSGALLQRILRNPIADPSTL
jgi:iron complex transport system permease protein